METVLERPSTEELERWNIRIRLPHAVETAKNETGKDIDDWMLFDVAVKTATAYVQARMEESPIKEMMPLMRMNDCNEKHLEYTVARTLIETGAVDGNSELRSCLSILCDWLYPVFKAECDRTGADSKPHEDAYVGIV